MGITAPLSTTILNSYKTLISVSSQVPLAYKNLKLIQATGGALSVCDLIAYQIGWGKLLIHWYNSGLQSENIVMPGHGFSTWDYTGLAKYFYSKYGYDGHTIQLEEFKKVITLIIKIVDSEYASGNLEKIGVWDWCTLPSGKQWPLSKWVIVNTSSPYKRATALIRKCMKENLKDFY